MVFLIELALIFLDLDVWLLVFFSVSRLITKLLILLIDNLEFVFELSDQIKCLLILNFLAKLLNYSEALRQSRLIVLWDCAHLLFKLTEVFIVVIGLIIVFINSVYVVLPAQLDVHFNLIYVLLVWVKLIGQISISCFLLFHYEIVLWLTTVQVKEEIKWDGSLLLLLLLLIIVRALQSWGRAITKWWLLRLLFWLILLPCIISLLLLLLLLLLLWWRHLEIVLLSVYVDATITSAVILLLLCRALLRIVHIVILALILLRLINVFNDGCVLFLLLLTASTTMWRW